ncbi:hypothetical protein BpHYR1_021378 [Brachionus plicatilis]|uniref:Uncharacterized protein n=1 Tax=Brachionus plicatilis TaxID=10195 RepID=A0A3M7R6V6_BRAPC|nr:hypothetical protein BpHYR1_021378 [Brachionus plicatilis]
MCLAYKNDPTSSYQKLSTDFNSKTQAVRISKSSYITAQQNRDLNFQSSMLSTHGKLKDYVN